MEAFAPYYYFVYWLMVMLLTMDKFNSIRCLPSYTVIQKRDSYQPLVLFSVFYILFFGLRPMAFGTGLFGDTGNYANTYELMQQFGVYNKFGAEEAGKDWLFFTLMFSCSQIMDVHLFFLICMFIYIVPMFVACKLLDRNHGALLMLFCIGSFQFYTYSVNGVRNGMACSIVLLALAFLIKEKKLWSLLLSLVALGIHKSTVLPIVSMYFIYYVRKPKLMFYIWLGAIVVSLAIGGYIDNLLSALSYDERLAGNLQKDDADGLILEHRFRWDFLLYSSMPILLGWYTIFKRKLHDNTYLILLGTYIYANSFWVLAIRAIFSNRIAYLSWFIYPIVLAYPLLNFPVFKKNHSQKTAWILLGHFGFTTILWLLGK